MNNIHEGIVLRPEENNMFKGVNQVDYSALDTNLRLIQDMLGIQN